MLLNEPCAELKKALIIPLTELIQNHEPRVVTQGAEERTEVRVERNTHGLLCNIYVACKAGGERWAQKETPDNCPALIFILFLAVSQQRPLQLVADLVTPKALKPFERQIGGLHHLAVHIAHFFDRAKMTVEQRGNLVADFQALWCQ